MKRLMTLFVCLAVVVVGSTATAVASVTQPTTYPPVTQVATPSCGKVLFPTTASGAWVIPGGGVPVYSNGQSDEGTDSDCVQPAPTYSYVDGVRAGEEWQCVEFVNRLYLTRGWISSQWVGDAGEPFWQHTPSNLVKQPNKSVTYLGPGDVVIIEINNNPDDGHALVVNNASDISSGSVNLVSQNSGLKTNSEPVVTGTLSKGTVTVAGGGNGFTYTTIGVIHAPVSTPPAINTRVLSTAAARKYFSEKLQETGGAPPYRWSWVSVPAGHIPAGLNLGSATGVISGTPARAGTTALTVTVIDAEGQSAMARLSLVVTISITPDSAPLGRVLEPYSLALEAWGGDAPYTWSWAPAEGDQVPSGLVLDGSTGVIHGSAGNPGTYVVDVTAKDRSGETVSATYGLTFLGASQPLLGGVKSVTASDSSFCALLGSGGVECWGSLVSASDGAVVVRGVGDASFLAGDDAASYCAVVSNGEVTCWGQLGTPTGAPATVPGLANVTSLAGTSGSFCGVLHGGQVDCWGTNDNGRLGIGNTNFDYSTAKPARVAGIGSVRNLAVSGDDRYCAALVSGNVYCWGGIKPYDTDTPVQVPNVIGAAGVVADDSGTFCAIERGGALACWGWDSNGELGDGTVGRFSSRAVAVKGLASVTSLVGTIATFCAIVSGGNVYCWGASNAGQAGLLNPGLAPVLTPVEVQGLSGATQLSGGYDVFCARMAEEVSPAGAGTMVGRSATEDQHRTLSETPLARRCPTRWTGSPAPHHWT